MGLVLGREEEERMGIPLDRRAVADDGGGDDGDLRGSVATKGELCEEDTGVLLRLLTGIRLPRLDREEDVSLLLNVFSAYCFKHNCVFSSKIASSSANFNKSSL